jgi:hypothetical protein
MDIHSILAELRSEKDRLEEAILTIERLAVGSLTKRRGRPPKWIAEARGDADPSAGLAIKKRRRFSAATRKRMAESQRKRWASRRATAQAA